MIVHSPDFESFGAAIKEQTGLRGGSIYKVVSRFTERGYLRVSRVEPARHGTPRRWVRLTEAGRALAVEWGVMRRATLAAERLREIATALSLPDDGPLHRAAAVLDEHDLPDVGFDPDKLVDAVLGAE